MEDSDKDVRYKKAKLRSLQRFQKTAKLTKQARKKVKQKTEYENIKYKRFDSKREKYNCPKQTSL